jgi:DHA2 family metal-tetracycline-proton antiporter-like MFS transporter
MTLTSTTPARTVRGPVLLAVLMPAMLATVIASDMVNLMLPSIGADFAASEAELAWVVTGFLLMFSVGIPFYGRLSDRFSLRGLFSVGLIAYAAGSLMCALAPSLPVLVGGRVVMGIGAAAIPVLAIIAVTRLLTADRRGTGIGVLSAAAGIGTAAGPTVGGGIGQLFGWPALFWLMFAVAVVLLPLVLRVLPGGRPEDPGRFDLLGGVLLGAGAGLVLFGVTQAQVAGFAAPSSWASIVAAALALALFARRTACIAHPFVPPALFANRVYRNAVVVGSLAMGVNLGGLVFVALLVVNVNGLTPGEGSLVMIPAGAAVAVLSPVIGRLSDRIGLAAMGLFALLLSAVAGGDSVVPVGVGLLGLSIGFILVMTPIISAAAGSLQTEQVGVGLGILQGAQFLGAGAGPALFGVLLAAKLENGGDALSPLRIAGRGTAFADVFLVMAAVVVVALVVAFRMRPKDTA